MTAVLDLVTDPPVDEPTPVDLWIRRQQDMSAVERFSALHSTEAPTARNRWVDRLPAAPPGPGQQYSFEVDLDACTGCKACVAACHSLNGLDDGEQWRRVGTVQGAAGVDVTEAGRATVTSACHHCVDPACLNGCPANAYEKDPVTGIVRHLDDACIGCSYCTLTCPYEVPTYNAALGIVRKCDMCTGRLDAGEAPACVQGCPQGAITIGVVTTADLVAAVRGPDAPTNARLVPNAPRSTTTVPTTTYRSSSPLPDDWTSGDGTSVHPSHGHTPLAVMLVLTQAAVGMTLAAWLLETSDRLDAGTRATEALATVGLVTGLVAVAASVLHLGRPLLAWRAVLGFRRSWLSREIVAFGAFAATGFAAAALRLVDESAAARAAQGLTAATGTVAVGCSVLLYAVTGRRWWHWRTTAARFGSTTVAVGSMATATVLAAVLPDDSTHPLPLLGVVALVGLVASVVAPWVPLLFRRGATLDAELNGTRRLLTGELWGRALLRFIGAGAAVLLLGFGLTAAGTASAVLLGLATLTALAGEYHERRLFFLASVAPRMPGTPR